MLEVKNTGRGRIGELASGWSIQYSSSPMVTGFSTGKLGSVNFTCSCDTSIKFLIDNEVSVAHYLNDRTSQELSGMDGYVRTVESAGYNADVTVVSRASALDTEAVATSYMSGTYQRLIELPQQVAYVANSVTYYTGGTYAVVDGVTVWKPYPITIYDVAAEGKYINVLAKGSHGGEVVYRMGIDGKFISVWPVYSDANDLIEPQSRWMAYAGGFLFIGQASALRVKKFLALNGAYQSQWGTVGTGNSQFTTMSGLAAGVSAPYVYVTDSSLNRVQRFTYSGTYQNQWGSFGNDSDPLHFNGMNSVSFDETSSTVWLGDQNGHIKEYSSTGTYIGEPIGYWAQYVGTRGELKAGNLPTDVTFDSLGYAYVIQDGRVQKFARITGQYWDAYPPDNLGYSRAIQSWNTNGKTVPKISASGDMGIIHIPRTERYVEQWSGSPGNLQAYILYYVALGKPDFPVRFADDLCVATTVNAYPFLGWEGNVWNMLGDLCAATKNSMVMFGGYLYFTCRQGKNFELPDGVKVSPVEYDSSDAGHEVVAINNQAVRYTDLSIMYDARWDSRNISVGVGETLYITIAADSYPEHVLTPGVSNQRLDGAFMVRDSSGNDATFYWIQGGGRMTASVSDTPGEIDLVITAPTQVYGGVESYRFEDGFGVPALSIQGRGVIATPTEIRISTGVGEGVTGRHVAATVESPFIYNASLAYTEAAWAAYLSSSPSQKVTFVLPRRNTFKWSDDGLGNANGTAFMVNCVVTYGDAQYIVDEVTSSQTSVVLKCYRYTKTGLDGYANDFGVYRPEELWSGKTAAEFDSLWSGYLAQDFSIAPLRTS